MPSACAAIPMRPPSSVAIAMRKPRPSSCSSRSRPTRAPSIARSDVVEELSPSFSSSRVIRTCSASSTKQETPRAPAVSGSVRAKSRNVPARDPFVIHCLEPFSTQSSPSDTALVRSEPASEPAPGSVSANAPSCSPRASGGTKRARCSSVPNARIGSVVGARVDGDGDADARIRARELLEHEDVREEVRSRAAVLLGHAHTHQPELGELREQLVREAVLAIPLARVRDDLRLGELAGERLDRPLVGRELEVHQE